MKDSLFSDIIKTHPAAIFLKLPLAIISGLILPLTMYLTQRMIDGISTDSSSAFCFLICLAFVYVLSVFVIHFDAYLSVQISNRIEFIFGKKILNKISKIRCDNFENDKTHNMIGRILDKYKTSAISIINITTSCIRIIIMFAGFFYYLVIIRWWVLPILLITALPIFFLSVYTSMKEYDTFSKYYPFLRKANYYSGLITGRGSIKEARLFQYEKFVEKLWEISIKKFQIEQVHANLTSRILAGLCILLQYASTALNLFFIYPSVINGHISLGIYIAIAQAMWSFVGDFQYQMIGIVKDIADYKKFREDYTIFNNDSDGSVTDESKYKEIKIFSEIKLTDVWFQYRADSPYILRDISLTIQYGEKIGLVGENGSGKSTLIKIILGLFPPTKGMITIDDVAISDNNRYLLRNIASAVFQDYGHYNLTLSESISLSNIGHYADVGKMNRIISNLHKEDDFLESFNNGMNTELGKDRWDGQDLSGGQWQTIALARSIYANKPFLVLDEPTAALDPLSEVDVYKHIYQDSEIQTVLFVTHRLGAIVMADKIVLLENGAASEFGTHIQLLEKRGLYAKMFDTQSQWYSVNTKL